MTGVRRADKPDTEADVALRSCLDAVPKLCFVMVAGAGSGKTTSLVKALTHLLRTKGPEFKRRSQRVACITYTEVARDEILADVGSDPRVHVATIHSFLWNLVEAFQADIAHWMSGRIATTLDELRHEERSFSPKTRAATRERVASRIERYQKRQETVASVSRFRYGIGASYEDGVLGHDDVLKLATKLLMEKPLLRQILASKYPYVFVDESQDTLPAVVEAMKAVAIHAAGDFCLGFFGDPMQKIYATGAGDIVMFPEWKRITKPENFRSPAAVVDVINRIRRAGDGLEQCLGHVVPREGTARLFVLPADDQRDERLRLVRSWIAEQNGDPSWHDDHAGDDGVKVLVIEHRMAAKRLGFSDLFAAFNDGTSDGLKNAFREGSHWILSPYLDVILPLVAAFVDRRDFEVMSLLRRYCAHFDRDQMKGALSPAATLSSVKDALRRVATMLSAMSDATVADIHDVASTHLMRFDDRFAEVFARAAIGDAEDDAVSDDSALRAFMRCPARQLWAYQRYRSDESPFSTQQGVKGAEFPRVLTILDDEEGRHFQFSYEKYFGLVPPSQTDLKNISEGRETVIDRTRRLFYVCCSRATKDLAVVLFSKDASASAEIIRRAGIFDDDAVLTLEDLTS